MKRFVRDQRQQGFTLIEVIIAMTVFIFLCMAVFGIMTSVLESTSALQSNQSRHDQLSALNELVRTKLLKLTSHSSVMSYRLDAGTDHERTGLILDYENQAIAFDLQTQANGYYTLRLTTYQRENSLSQSAAILLNQAIIQSDPTLNWTPLIHDVQKLSWSFRDANAIQWLHDWTSPGTRPSLIELSIQLAGDLQPSTFDFWLPHLDGGAAPGQIPKP